MNKLILFLLFLLPLSLIGQVESQFNGTLNVFSASRIGFTNTFTISGIFSSTTTSYTSANSATGDIIQVQSGIRFYWMHIYSIASNSGGVITCNVRDSSSTLTTFPTGKWSIFRPTTNLRLPLSPDGETNASRSATFNTLALRVDDIQQQVSSSTNCERTITKTAHGFRKWTPVYWTGSNYVRPPYDSLVPDYVVVDSLTANTFKVASCGTYATVLPDGLYWFTSQSPGYSLTPDTTKAPLFQVIDSVLVLNPIIGFNLMSGNNENVTYTSSDSTSTGGNPNTTNGVVNILKYTGNGSTSVPSFGTVPNIYNEDGYINSNSRYVQTSGATSKDLFIGYFGQNTTVFNPNTTQKNLRGLYISPSYQEGVGLIHMDSSSRNYTNLYMSPYFMNITSSEGTKYNTISIGNNSGAGNTSKIRFNGLNNSSVNYSYAFPTESPAIGTGALSALSWNNGTPSFLRSQHGVATGTTDGSGDLTLTFAAAMPDVTYSLIATVEGTTSYTISVHTKATGTCKVRFFNPTTGAAVTATSVTISYEAKNY